MRPARSVFAPVAEASAAASGDAATPAAQRIVRAAHRLGDTGTRDRDRRLLHAGDARVDRDVDAEGGERLLSLRGELRRVRGQDARPPFDEEDAGLRRVDRAELATQRVARDLAERARELDSRGPGSDDHEREERAPLGGIRRRLRALEREQDAAPHLDRVLERLQARRRGLPIVVPEVVVAHAGGDDQDVVGKLAARRQDAAAGDVESGHVFEQDARVPAPLQDRPEGRGDVRGREGTRRHLIEKRLEEMEIPPVENGDLDRERPEAAGRVQAAETPAHDHDAREGRVH